MDQDPSEPVAANRWASEVREVSPLQALMNESYRAYRGSVRALDGTRSSAQYRILGALAYLGETRLADLAAYEQISHPAVAKVFVALEQEGLVERRPDPNDRRASLASVTDAGIAEFRSQLRRLDAALPKLTEDENETLRAAAQILRRLSRHAPQPPAA